MESIENEIYRLDKIISRYKRSRNLLYRFRVKASKIIFSLYSMEKTNKHWIAFRVKRSSIDGDTFTKFLHKYNKTFVVSENEKTNHHLQGLILFETKNKILQKSAVDQFRKSLKDSNGLKGNKDFSVKGCDNNDKYIRYLCKGDSEKEEPKIFQNNILLENEIRLTHLNYWKENKELKATDGHKKYHQILEVELSKKMQNFMLSAEDTMAMKIVLWHEKNDKLIPDPFSLKKMVNTYLMKQEPDKEAYALKYINSIYHPDH